MYINEEFIPEILPIYPNGTNSTMFTECCDTAICDDERCCPKCRRKIIGFDAKSNHEREMIRWSSATRFWPKRKY